MVRKILKTMFLMVLIIVIVIAYLIKTFDINKYKLSIEKEISYATGQSVKIERLALDFSIAEGVLLKVYNIQMSGIFEDQIHEKTKIKEIVLNVSIKGYLEKKRIIISEVILNDPVIEITRSVNHKSENSQSIKPDDEKKEPVKSTSDSDEGRSENNIISMIMVEVMNVGNGTMRYIDETVNPNFDLNINDIDLKTKDFAFNRSFEYSLNFSLMSEEQNIKLLGTALIDEKGEGINLSNSSFKTDLSKISVQELVKLMPAIDSLGLGKDLYGSFALNLNDAKIGTKGLERFDLSGEVIDGKLSLSTFEYPIDNIDLKFRLNEKDAKIEQLFMYIDSGTLSLKSEITDYLKAQEYSLDINIEDVDLNEAIGKYAHGVKTEGRIFANFKGSGKGFDIKNKTSDLNGQGHFNIDNGKIVDVNLLKVILEKISLIPNLAKKIEEQLSENDKEKLQAKDTDFEKVNFDILVHDKFVTISNTHISTNDFLVLAEAKCDFDGDLNLRSDFYIKEDLSRIMTATINELALLKDSNRIHIPMKDYQGKFDKVITYPDIEAIGKTLFKEKGKTELRKVLFNALGIETEGVDQQDKADPGAENIDQNKDGLPAKQEEIKKEMPTEAIIIDNVLDMIFH